jgi:hypothetical protein
MTNDVLLKKVKFLVMLILGIVMVAKPNSLLVILLFILGAYLTVLGFNAFISCITLIKFKKGLFILFVGIMAIARAKENSAGIMFIILGLLIALFPLGVSALITRVIGASLMGLSVYLLISLSNSTKSS